jgi:hypothetical protein
MTGILDRFLNGIKIMDCPLLKILIQILLIGIAIIGNLLKTHKIMSALIGPLILI